MTFPRTNTPVPSVWDTDLPLFAFETARQSHLLAWDIETSGVDWSVHRIATCQLLIPSIGGFIVRVGGSPPSRLKALLESPNVPKLFRHAAFDLPFMAAPWQASPANIRCTKVAAKVLSPGQ